MIIVRNLSLVFVYVECILRWGKSEDTIEMDIDRLYLQIPLFVHISNLIYM